MKRACCCPAQWVDAVDGIEEAVHRRNIGEQLVPLAPKPLVVGSA
jgi:hypothetical protein